MDDNTLKQLIVDELDFEPSIDTAGIEVMVENGMVALTGHVSTYAQKGTVEDVVRRVKGVRGIAEELEVRPAHSHRTSDEEIARRAVNSISWNTSVPDGAVQVAVEKGLIALTGKVEWQYQKTAAADAVRRLAGVTGVRNEIDVVPQLPARDTSAREVKRRIEDALKRNAEVEAQAIKVSVHDGGEVVLDGQVQVWSARRAAERAAWSAPGVRTVEDRITIG